jgi:hypothetical protein
VDFVDWCTAVLGKLVDLAEADPMFHLMGADESQLAAALFGEEIARTDAFNQSTRAEFGRGMSQPRRAALVKQSYFANCV